MNLHLRKIAVTHRDKTNWAQTKNVKIFYVGMIKIAQKMQLLSEKTWLS